ncbi:hypothetical protein QF015_002170 [Paenarthrobacter sp. TE4293]
MLFASVLRACVAKFHAECLPLPACLQRGFSFDSFAGSISAGGIASPMHTPQTTNTRRHLPASVNRVNMIRSETLRVLPKLRIQLPVLELPQKRATTRSTRKPLRLIRAFQSLTLRHILPIIPVRLHTRLRSTWSVCRVSMKKPRKPIFPTGHGCCRAQSNRARRHPSGSKAARSGQRCRGTFSPSSVSLRRLIFGPQSQTTAGLA